MINPGLRGETGTHTLGTGRMRLLFHTQPARPDQDVAASGLQILGSRSLDLTKVANVSEGTADEFGNPNAVANLSTIMVDIPCDSNKPVPPYE